MSAEISCIDAGVEPAAQVQEPGLGEERRDVVVVVVGRERAGEVERRPVAILERHRAARVHRPVVDQRAQHHPPVEEVAEVAARHPQRAAGEERHRRLQVVDDIGDVGVGELDARDAVVARPHAQSRLVERERPRARRRDDGERLDTRARAHPASRGRRGRRSVPATRRRRTPGRRPAGCWRRCECGSPTRPCIPQGSTLAIRAPASHERGRLP